MNDVKRFLLPLGIAVPALFAGIAIGRYATPAPAAAPARSSNATPSTAADGTSSNAPKVAAAPDVTAESEADEPDANQSSSSLISRMKAALGRPNSRHTYATFSKLADSIDPKNVR